MRITSKERVFEFDIKNTPELAKLTGRYTEYLELRVACTIHDRDMELNTISYVDAEGEYVDLLADPSISLKSTIVDKVEMWLRDEHYDMLDEIKVRRGEEQREDSK